MHLELMSCQESKKISDSGLGNKMVMLRPPGKAHKIAKAVMKNQGIKIRSAKVLEKAKLTGPYLQH